MREVIILNDEQKIKINSRMGWLETYRAQFGRDILPDLMPLLEATIQTVMQTLGSVNNKDISEMASALIDEGTLDEAFITASQFEITTLMHIVWAMAVQEGETDTPEEWANKLESFPLDEVGPKLLKILTKSFISTKNLKSLQETMKGVSLSVLKESLSQESQEG